MWAVGYLFWLETCLHQCCFEFGFDLGLMFIFDVCFDFWLGIKQWTLWPKLYCTASAQRLKLKRAASVVTYFVFLVVFIMGLFVVLLFASFLSGEAATVILCLVSFYIKMKPHL